MSQMRILCVGLLLTACAGDREISVTRVFPFSADVVYETAMARFGDAHRISPHMFNVRYLDGAEAPAVGVQREVWTTEDGDSFMHEELLTVDPENRYIQIAIIYAEKVPVNTDESVVESTVTPIDEETSSWTTNMLLRTRPAFLGTFAEGGVQSDIEDMLIGLEHHILTGEDITPERFEQIEADYR
ncbi:MAG: SRPBCC family protein [Myxococcota bacterium]